MLNVKNNYDKTNDYPDVTFMDQQFFFKKLLIILSIGFFVSAVTFLTELSLANIAKLKNNKIFKNIGKRLMR